jgi:hypothetical protein
MRQFSSNDFSYNKGLFTADASDLQLPPGAVMREFEIRSERTGKVMRFVHSSNLQDAEGEVWAFCYTGQNDVPKYKRVIASIFND